MKMGRTHVTVGPSLGAPGSNGKVPGLATLSQAVLLMRIAQGFEHENEMVFSTLSIVSIRLKDQSRTAPCRCFKGNNRNDKINIRGSDRATSGTPSGPFELTLLDQGALPP